MLRYQKHLSEQLCTKKLFVRKINMKNLEL